MARLTRVLHCINTLGGGGAERDLRNFLLHSGSTVFEHGVYAWRDGEFGPAIREHGVPVFLQPASKTRPWSAVLSLKRVVRAWQPQLIQSWGVQFDVIAGVVGRLLNVPVVGSEQSNRHQYLTNYRRRWFTVLRHWTLRHCAAGVFANSPAGARYIREDLRVSAPIEVIPNGLDLGVIEAMPPIERAALSVPESASLLVTASRLIPLKRIDLILSALAVLRTQGIEVYLAVCGVGPEQESLERKRTDLHLEDRVRLLGNRADVAGIMKSGDLFCNASEVEGMPNAVLEAMACGLPVLVSDIPAHSDLLEGQKVGLLFKEGSEEDLAAKLNLLLASPTLCAELGQNARRYSREFTLENRCVRLEAFHQAILSSARSGGPRAGQAA